MTGEEARRRFGRARHAHLATADAGGRPHLVPMVFALDGDNLYSAVDHKPKRSLSLRRLSNIAGNPAVSVLVDHYEEESWDRLWWVRADGVASVLEAGSPGARLGVELLMRRYRHYTERPPAGQVIAIGVRRWSGWAASEAG